jgi:hypothetical protein
VARAGITAYLPGPLKHQTIRVSLQSQQQYPLNMSRPAFINLMNPPRGLHGIFGEKLSQLSADYVFPLLYPDLELGPLLYIQRIRGALWGDYMNGSNVIIHHPDPHFEDRTYSTVGVDLVADVHILRISFPLSFGGRFIYEPDTGWWKLEGIFSVDIN